jgi:hypothetical protein
VETPHTEQEDEYTQEIFHIPTPKQMLRREPIEVKPVVASSDKPKRELRSLQKCEQCARAFVSRNKLFAHLRTTNHFNSPHRAHINEPIIEDQSTANDPTKERSSEVIKSKSKMVPGTGYAFRDFNFLEVNVRLEAEGKDELVCVDTGCGMSLVDEDWLEEQLPGATILNRASTVKIRGLGKEEHLTNKYLVIQRFLPEIGGTGRVAEIRREFHLVKGLGCKILLGNDVIKPERWVIDVAEGKMTLWACEDMICELKVTPRGRQVICRKVRTSQRITVKPNSTIMIPVSYKKGLPSGRDFEFTPVYDESIAYLMEAGGFSRALVNSETALIPFHNRSPKALTITKNTTIGAIDDWTSTTYHGAVEINPEEHPVLASYHEDGIWKPSAKHNTARPRPAPYSGQASGTIDTVAPGRKAKFGVSNTDINRKEDISKLQVKELEALLQEFTEIFEDRETVAIEPEEDWVRIQLKEGADLTSKGPYNNGAKDKAVIDKTFGKMHNERKLSWAKGGAIGWPVFVVWNNGKGRVVVDIHGLNTSTLSDAYPMPRQEDIMQGIRESIGCRYLT